jgi:hypothetical protein
MAIFQRLLSVLGLPAPELYWEPHQEQEMVFHHTTGATTFTLNPRLWETRSEKELAFLSAQQLIYLRPDYALCRLIPTAGQLKTIFLAALKLINPQVLVPAAERLEVEKMVSYLTDQGRLPPAAREQLRGLVQQFCDSHETVDLSRWQQAVMGTVNRLGFIFCNDLEVAVRLSMANSWPLDNLLDTPVDPRQDLLRYSVSEAYFRVRRELGMTVRAAAHHPND